MPAPIGGVPGLDANLRLQDEVASRLRDLRYERGALDLESIEARPVFENDVIRELRVRRPIARAS
jgi:exoribonuclease-2